MGANFFTAKRVYDYKRSVIHDISEYIFSQDYPMDTDIDDILSDLDGNDDFYNNVIYVRNGLNDGVSTKDIVMDNMNLLYEATCFDRDIDVGFMEALEEGWNCADSTIRTYIVHRYLDCVLKDIGYKGV